MIKFDYIAPKTIAKAIKILDNKKKYSFIIAGGTDLLIKIRKKSIKPQLVISLKKIKNLDKISCDKKKGITIGANVTLANLAKNKEIIEIYPTIVKSILVTANPQVRNIATLVGNICNASPSADNSAILLAMNSIVNIISVNGEKSIPLEKFFLGPSKTILANNEIVESIFIPLPSIKTGTSYVNFSQNSNISCTIAGVSSLLTIEKKRYTNVRIFICGCGPTPIRAIESEKQLINKSFENDKFIKKASSLSHKRIEPITDIRGSAAYRKNLVKILVERSLNLAQNMVISKKILLELR